MARWQESYGFVDAVRAVIPPERKLFTWWSYRARDWSASDRGLRLDHVWLSPALAPGPGHRRGPPRRPRLGLPLGPRPGDGGAGGLATPRRPLSRIAEGASPAITPPDYLAPAHARGAPAPAYPAMNASSGTATAPQAVPAAAANRTRA
jgi:hypothetical protein